MSAQQQTPDSQKQMKKQIVARARVNRKLLEEILLGHGPQKYKLLPDVKRDLHKILDRMSEPSKSYKTMDDLIADEKKTDRMSFIPTHGAAPISVGDMLAEVATKLFKATAQGSYTMLASRYGDKYKPPGATHLSSGSGTQQQPTGSNLASLGNLQLFPSIGPAPPPPQTNVQQAPGYPQVPQAPAPQPPHGGGGGPPPPQGIQIPMPAINQNAVQAPRGPLTTMLTRSWTDFFISAASSWQPGQGSEFMASRAKPGRERMQSVYQNLKRVRRTKQMKRRSVRSIQR